MNSFDRSFPSAIVNVKLSPIFNVHLSFFRFLNKIHFCTSTWSRDAATLNRKPEERANHNYLSLSGSKETTWQEWEWKLTPNWAEVGLIWHELFPLQALSPILIWAATWTPQHCWFICSITLDQVRNSKTCFCIQMAPGSQAAMHFWIWMHPPWNMMQVIPLGSHIWWKFSRLLFTCKFDTYKHCTGSIVNPQTYFAIDLYPATVQGDVVAETNLFMSRGTSALRGRYYRCRCRCC